MDVKCVQRCDYHLMDLVHYEYLLSALTDEAVPSRMVAAVHLTSWLYVSRAFFLEASSESNPVLSLGLLTPR